MKVRRRTSSQWRPRIGGLNPFRWVGKLPTGRNRWVLIGVFLGSMIIGYGVAAVAVFPAPLIGQRLCKAPVAGLLARAHRLAITEYSL